MFWTTLGIIIFNLKLEKHAHVKYGQYNYNI